MEHNELETLYCKYYRSLFLYALSLTKSRADAEDLVADTFIKAYLSYTSGKGDILPWMMVVLKRIFIDQYRRRQKLADDGEVLLQWVEAPQNVLADYIRSEQQRWIYSQIYALPQPEREVMLLSAAGRVSDQQIAKIVNLTVNHVRVMKHRVRKKLAELAKKEGYL